MTGVLALVGGAEWREGCTFDAELLEASDGAEVLVLPTAAAYEHPERAVETAARWFEGLGGKVRGLMVLGRPDAEEQGNADAVAAARFVYLGGGSPLHLRSVLKETKVWDALVHAWQGGAVVAASSAGAMVLGDPMVDPRGGAYTLGLGLIEQLAVIPHHDTWPAERAHRTMQLAPRGVPLVAVDERTAVIRGGDGGWRAPARRRCSWTVSRSDSTRFQADRAAGRRRRVPQSASVMVTDWISTRSDGLPDRLPTASISATTSSPDTTLPKSA